MWMLSILGTATAEPSRLSPIFINTWPCSMCGQGGHVANGLCARDNYDGCKPLRSGIYSCVNAWGVQKVQSCHATHAANQFHDPSLPHLEIATAGWPADKIFASHPYGSEPQHKVGTFGRHSFTMFHIIPFPVKSILKAIGDPRVGNLHTQRCSLPRLTPTLSAPAKRLSPDANSLRNLSTDLKPPVPWHGQTHQQKWSWLWQPLDSGGTRYIKLDLSNITHELLT